MEIKKLATMDMNVVLEGYTIEFAPGLRSRHVSSEGLIVVSVSNGESESLRIIKYDQATGILAPIDSEPWLGNGGFNDVSVINAGVFAEDSMVNGFYYNQYTDEVEITELRYQCYNDDAVIGLNYSGDSMLPYIPVGGIPEDGSIDDRVSYVEVDTSDESNKVKLILKSLRDTTSVITDINSGEFTYDYMNDRNKFYVLLRDEAKMSLSIVGAGIVDMSPFETLEIPDLMFSGESGSITMHMYNDKLYMFSLNASGLPKLIIVTISKDPDTTPSSYTIIDLTTTYSLANEVAQNKIWGSSYFNDCYLYLNNIVMGTFLSEKTFILDLDTMLPVVPTVNQVEGGPAYTILGLIKDKTKPFKKLAIIEEIVLIGEVPQPTGIKLHVIEFPSLSDKLTMEKITSLDQPFNPMISKSVENVDILFGNNELLFANNMYLQYDKTNKHLYVVSVGRDMTTIGVLNADLVNPTTVLSHMTLPANMGEIERFSLYDKCLVCEANYNGYYAFIIIPKTGTALGKPVSINTELSSLFYYNDKMYGTDKAKSFIYSFDLPAYVVADGAFLNNMPQLDIIYAAQSSEGYLNIINIDEGYMYITSRGKYLEEPIEDNKWSFGIIKIKLEDMTETFIPLDTLKYFDFESNSPIITVGDTKYLVTRAQYNNLNNGGGA